MSFARERLAAVHSGATSGKTCRRVAPPHILFLAMTGNIKSGPEEQRAEAALVYRDESRENCWVVGAPSTGNGEQRAFTGPNACQAALEFAHRTYGSARYFAN